MNLMQSHRRSALLYCDVLLLVGELTADSARLGAMQRRDRKLAHKVEPVPVFRQPSASASTNRVIHSNRPHLVVTGDRLHLCAGCNSIMDATVQGKPFKVIQVKVRDGKAGPDTQIAIIDDYLVHHSSLIRQDKLRSPSTEGNVKGLGR
jgi:hypothetical protein